MNERVCTSLRLLGVGRLHGGYFRVKLGTDRGVYPWVGARLIYGPPTDPDTGEELDRHHRWQAFLDGELVGTVLNEDDSTQPDVLEVWRIYMGERISRDDHDHLLAVAAHCREHAPGLPEANPRRPIDLAQMKPLF